MTGEASQEEICRACGGWGVIRSIERLRATNAIIEHRANSLPIDEFAGPWPDDFPCLDCARCGGSGVEPQKKMCKCGHEQHDGGACGQKDDEGVGCDCTEGYEGDEA